jgi:hypothetical protein
MLSRVLINFAVLFLTLGFTTPSFAEADATMHDVYLAAEAGKFAEAQSMMDKVLSDHPNSAKAHFVEAELLAKQGQYSNASVELSKAEQIQPGLPFVKPETLQKLKGLIAGTSNNSIQPAIVGQALPGNAKEWMPVLLFVLGLSFIILLIVFLRQRNSNAVPANNYAGNVPGRNIPPVGTNAPGSVMGQPAAGGMGSGLMGNLAAGAALGAGVVAGEALMHHFIDGDGKNNNAHTDHTLPDSSPWGGADHVADNDDMGGTDFGIADASSWDDDSADDNNDDWT